MLVGDVSTGKTHMASALCMLACERRMEARFFTASSLVMRLRRAPDEGRLDREAALIGCARLLVIDELGFLPLDPDGARALLGVRRRLRAAVGGHHHEPGVQPVGRGVRRRPDGGGRAHRQGHGHVGLALPVLPKNTRSSRAPTKPSESMSSRPQPSENRTCDQSNPSADLCTGSLACLSSRALLVASLCASSASSMALQPATCVLYLVHVDHSLLPLLVADTTHRQR